MKSKKKKKSHRSTLHTANLPPAFCWKKLLTVVLSLYSEEATVEKAAPAPCLDNKDRRSAASESTFTAAESPKRT